MDKELKDMLKYWDDPLGARTVNDAEDIIPALKHAYENAEAETIALRSMCRAAAEEIMEQWPAHCDDEKFGPCNLVARLCGDISPDLYPAYASDEEIERFGELTLKSRKLEE